MRKPLVLPFICLLSVTSCSTNSFVLEDKLFCFDTVISLSLYECGNNDLNALKDIIKCYDKISDNYVARDITNVYTLNHTNEEVSVSKELYNLLLGANNFHLNNSSLFNPLCGSLAKLWKDSLAEKKIPDSATIQEELNKINSSSILLKDNNVVQRLGDAEIDLGGYVKGYTLDRMKDYLVSKEYKHYLVDGGSSSILLGEKKTNDGYFTVGLREVTNAYIRAKNCFVSTSSVYVQGVTIEGVTYSHIVNPVTGEAINKQDGVIVISDNGATGDAYSTALMLYDLEDIKLVESSQNIKTIVIKNNKVIYHHPEVEVLYH